MFAEMFILSSFSQRMTTTPGTMFPCDSCDRKYTRKDNLRRHKKFECGKEPQFYCSHCPYRAKYKGTLQVHIALKPVSYTHLDVYKRQSLLIYIINKFFI